MVFELIAEDWVGDRDEQLRALADGFSVQVYYAVFRSNVVYMIAGGSYPSP